MSAARPMKVAHRLETYWAQTGRVPTLVNLTPAQRRRHNTKILRAINAVQPSELASDWFGEYHKDAS